MTYQFGKEGTTPISLGGTMSSRRKGRRWKCAVGYCTRYAWPRRIPLCREHLAMVPTWGEADDA